MTQDEFKMLKVGDRVGYRFERVTVKSVEYEYDWNSPIRPSPKFVWSVQWDNGTNSRLSDDISGLWKIEDGRT